jgi:hypothetical protein
VVSQDCDVVAPEDVEPLVEIVFADLVGAPDAQLVHGRNPRRLVLPLSGGAGFIEVDIRRRMWISKGGLAQHDPDAVRTLDPRDVRLLARWVSRRYVRAAFPDAFIERLRPAQKKLDSLCKSEGSRHVTAILVMLNEPAAELATSEAYRVVLWFAARSATLEVAATELQRFCEEFRAALAGCSGIIVDDAEVRSHDDITLDDLEQMKRFDYDYRSRGAKAGGEEPPDEM